MAKKYREQIQEAKEARGRAIEAHRKLIAKNKKYKKSTIASDGIKTINGWAKETPEGFIRADPKEISEYSKNVLEYEITKSGDFDYGGDRAEGFPGKRRASDA